MATRPNTQAFNSSCTQRRLIRHRTPIRIDYRRSETVLSPNDEHECQQIYEKLQQLQPNGVCVHLDTLRRALYPPISIPKDRNEQILSLKTSYQRKTEMPQIRTYHISKPTKIIPMNFDQIINQVKKHAAINYSYYTRTK